MPDNHSLTVDSATLLAQLEILGAIGTDPAGGRTRLALSDADKAARDTLVAWMRDLELEVRIDRIGTILGILQGTDATLAPVMVGSHIDTVINAGALDGCYGVLSGLAVVRALRTAGIIPRRSLMVAAFTNEEGVRYHPDMMGSLFYAGGISVEELLAAVGTDGTILGEELARIGYNGDMEAGAIVPHAYLELHIEQGPILEAAGQEIGVVAHLQGISWHAITVEGESNHAGTTPLAMRHDAGYVASAIVCFLRDLSRQSEGKTLATVGTMRFEPHAVNVIPRRARFTVDMRDPDDARLTAADQQLLDYLDKIAVAEGVTITAERLVRFPAVAFDSTLVDAIEAATVARGFSYRRMTSGAGHDAQMMARICPAAMIFVPSHKGISHNPAEHTDPAYLHNGAQVLLDVVLGYIS